MKIVRIATRKSPLALWQAHFIKERLCLKHPEIEIELHKMLTTADKMLAIPLNKIGGKGLFVKELEKSILEHRADMAVHSIKDMPTALPDGLSLAVVCQREDPRDVFVSNKYASIEDLPTGAILGTSSLRRKAQLLAIRSDLTIKSLRGNINTRLQKLDDNQYDAIVLAAAGLKRLKFEDRIRFYFDLEEMVPAAGQGAIGIECRLSDITLLNWISFLNDDNTYYAVTAERVLVEQLGGSCQFPIAAHAVVKNDMLYLTGVVGDSIGSTILWTKKFGPLKEACKIGLLAAEDLNRQGAGALLQKILKDAHSHDAIQ
jgi:hydroxymethylbilane synthase